MTRDGQGVYRNELEAGAWQRPSKVIELLDAARERPLTARELADNALRWQTLVQRLANNPSVPREVGAQAVLWRNEATARAERDADARHLLAHGREAEAFKTMSRYEFLREFPQHAQVVRRLEKAIDYAENEYANTADCERFVAQTRARLAERIAEGRYETKDRAQQKAWDDDHTR